MSAVVDEEIKHHGPSEAALMLEIIQGKTAEVEIEAGRHAALGDR